MNVLRMNVREFIQVYKPVDTNEDDDIDAIEIVEDESDIPVVRITKDETEFSPMFRHQIELAQGYLSGRETVADTATNVLRLVYY